MSRAYGRLPEEDVHANTGAGEAEHRAGERRTVLTIWYWPAYDELPEEVQALIAGHVTERTDWCQWLEQNRAVVGALLPAYDGAMEPATWNNLAGADLK